MANKVFNPLAIQQELNKVEGKAEKSYVDDNLSFINSSLEDITNTYAKKTEVNELASNKAEKTDLNVTNANVSKNATNIATQSARIDSFTRLTEGSTTGDAELIDGRVGADGNTYTNIGGAIRGQYNNLFTQINKNNLIFKNNDTLNSCIKRLELINFPSNAKVMCGMVRKSYTRNGTQEPQSVVGFYPVDENEHPIASKGMIIYLREWEVNKDISRSLRTKYDGKDVIINVTINLSTLKDDTTYNPSNFSVGGVNELFYKHHCTINPVVQTVYNDKPILTLIDDDAKYGFVTKAKPVLDELGLKCSLAVITDNVPKATQGKTLTLEELKSLKKEGFDILSHSATHSETIYKPGVATATDAEILEDMERSYNYLKENGLGTDTIVYPWGGFSDVARYAKLAKTYYKFGVNASGTTITDEVLYDMYLDRVFLRNAVATSTYTDLIDDTMNTNGWLILGCHSYTSDISADKIREVLTYAKNSGINILTFSEAIISKQNICSIGNYGERGNSLFIGRNGVIKNT